MYLYFVRHGESEANILRVISNRGFQHGLTDKGRQQAALVAQQLKGAPIVKIFSSPLMRAVQTAQILAQMLGVPYETADALREYDCGILEGMSDEASWSVYREVLNDWIEHGHWERRIEGGESFLDIKERFVPFIERLVAEYQDRPDGLVLVGHGGIYLCMLPLALTNVDLDLVMAHRLSNTGYVVAEATPEGLACREWHETITSS